MTRKWTKIYQCSLTLEGSVRRLDRKCRLQVQIASKKKSFSHFGQSLPVVRVERDILELVHFRFIIINTENHSSNQFTRKFLVDGRSIGQELERETLVFAIFVWLPSKCSFTTGFEVNKFVHLLQLDIVLFFDPSKPSSATTLQNVDYTFLRKLQKQSSRKILRLFI